jgi:hypothetical protein
MRSHLRALLAAATLGACTLASAANTATATSDPAAAAADTRASRHAEQRQRFFDQIDTNHDGVVSRDEYRSWIDSRFDKLDGNHDGNVDANEIASSPATQERVQKRADRFVQRLDTSGTGKVSLNDFEAKAMARFDRMANGGDTLTEDQLAGAGRRGWRHGHDATTTEPSAKQ